jgi:hypothetical protein
MKITEKRHRAARWLTGAGIEIGALHNPRPVPAQVSVRYVDRLSVDELRRHYPELGDEPMVPIDLIGDAENLSVLADDTQDFVIANHLLEHLENPLRGLQEMVRVLRPGGILYVALPDPRVTFDRSRDQTPTDHVIAEYRHGTEATREAHYAEWVERAEPLVEWMVAAGVAIGPQRVTEQMARSYSIHFHVWRPETFLEVIAAAREEAGVSLELQEFSACRPGEDDEYIFIFAKGRNGLLVPPPPGPDQVATLSEQLRRQETDAAATIAALERELERVSRDTAILRSLRRVAGRVPFGMVLARWVSRSLLRRQPT